MPANAVGIAAPAAFCIPSADSPVWAAALAGFLAAIFGSVLFAQTVIKTAKTPPDDVTAVFLIVTNGLLGGILGVLLFQAMR